MKLQNSAQGSLIKQLLKDTKKMCKTKTIRVKANQTIKHEWKTWFFCFSIDSHKLSGHGTTGAELC